jgi:hypothetical protein
VAAVIGTVDAMQRCLAVFLCDLAGDELILAGAPSPFCITHARSRTSITDIMSQL